MTCITNDCDYWTRRGVSSCIICYAKRFLFGELVFDETRLYENQPEYALLLAWHVASELIPKLREKGYKGKYFCSLPAPTIVKVRKNLAEPCARFLFHLQRLDVADQIPYPQVHLRLIPSADR